MRKKDNLLSRLRSLFAGPAKRRVRFRDSLGNFELHCPGGWRFDPDIAIVEGSYAVSFRSPDPRCQLTVSVDCQLPRGFRFPEHARKELEGPASGICADVRKCRFKGMDAYRREYSYVCGSQRYFGGGVMFFNGASVFSVSWSAPEEKKKELGLVFKRMLESLKVAGKVRA